MLAGRTGWGLGLEGSAPTCGCCAPGQRLVTTAARSRGGALLATAPHPPSLPMRTRTHSTQDVLTSLCRPPRSATKSAIDAHFADNVVLKSGAALARARAEREGLVLAATCLLLVAAPYQLLLRHTPFFCINPR